MIQMNRSLPAVFGTPITLTPRETALCLSACALGAVACLMTGMVAGMLLSPRKNVSIGSHNGGNVVENHVPAPKEEEILCEPC